MSRFVHRQNKKNTTIGTRSPENMPWNKSKSLSCYRLELLPKKPSSCPDAAFRYTCFSYVRTSRVSRLVLGLIRSITYSLFLYGICQQHARKHSLSSGTLCYGSGAVRQQKKKVTFETMTWCKDQDPNREWCLIAGQGL